MDDSEAFKGISVKILAIFSRWISTYSNFLSVQLFDSNLQIYKMCKRDKCFFFFNSLVFQNVS